MNILRPFTREFWIEQEIRVPLVPQPEVIVTCEDANRAAAAQLIAAEREYWRAFLARADSEDDARLAIKYLDELDALCAPQQLTR